MAARFAGLWLSLGFAAFGNAAVLRSEGLQVTFDEASGGLTSAVHLHTQREFLRGGAGRPLATLKLYRIDNASGREEECVLNSSDFRNISVRLDAAGTGLTVSFARPPATAPCGGQQAPDLEAVATARVASGDPWVRFGLEVTNRVPGWALRSAVFPGMEQVAALGPGDALLVPCFEGVVLPNPGASSLSHTQFAYPRGCPVQLLARYDDAGGLLTATLDAKGHVKGFPLHTVANESVRLEVEHFQPDCGPCTVALPYDTVLGPFGPGGWRAAAAVYKQWALQQPWTRRQLWQRADVPPVLLAGAPGVISSGLAKFGPHLEGLEPFVRGLQAKANVSRFLFVPYGWENRGVWAGINYFPARPSDDAWRNASARLEAGGAATMLLPSGYWWVVKRKATHNGPAFDDSGMLPSHRGMLIKASGLHNTSCPAGEAVCRWPFSVDAYDDPMGPQNWRGLSVSLCHGAANASRTMRDIFARTFRLGATVASFDQEIGGGQSAPCFDPSHGHPPGYGAYMWEGYKGVLEAIAADAAATGRVVSLSSEQTSELSVQHQATYWGRQFAVVDAPLRGMHGVGLFSYLYHEFVTVLAAALHQGQGDTSVRPHYLLRTSALAKALAQGTAAVPFDHDVVLNATGDAWRENVSAAYFAFAGVPSRFPEWLVFGEAAVPLRVVCASLPAWYVRNGARVNITVPAARAGSFFAGGSSGHAGRYGTVVASAAADAQRLDVHVGGRAGQPLTAYDGDRRVVQAFAAAPPRVALDLEAFGVAFLAFGGEMLV